MNKKSFFISLLTFVFLNTSYIYAFPGNKDKNTNTAIRKTAAFMACDFGYGEVTIQPNCPGDCSGEWRLKIDGGLSSGLTPPFRFGYNTGAVANNVPYDSLVKLTSLCAGTYTVTISDAAACTAIKNTTITNPSDIVVTSTITNVTCNGLSNGAVNITASGGTAPYTYRWSNAATTEDISSLPAGTYAVTVFDNKGCRDTTTHTVTQPTDVAAPGVITNVSCNGGSNGAVNITPSGGAGGYTHKWSNGATTEDITGLTAATYCVTTTDASGCKDTACFVVTQPSALTVTNTSTNATCNGTCNGAIDVTAGGGTPAYTYRWNDGVVTEDRTLLCAATYTVTVRDANNCSLVSTIVITQPAALTATIVSTNVLCNAGCTGSADLTPGGGTGAYTYNWSTGATTEDLLSTLCVGTYTVTLKDANACLTTASVTITEPAVLTVSTTSTNLLCNSECIGEINLTPGGGTVPYTYVWSNGASTEDLSALCAGTYIVTVKDVNDCKTNTSVTITQPAVLSATITSTNLVCNGICIGEIDLSPSGGTGAYTYIWSNGATTQDLASLCAGPYTVTLKDANACDTTFTVTITQPTALTATIVSTNVLCSGGCTGSADLTPGGGTGAYTYSWSNGITTQDQLGTLCPGTYTATVRDANACTTTTSAAITNPPALTVSTISTNLLCNGECIGAIDLTPGGGTLPYTYVWSNGATTEDLSSLCAGTYTVTVKDANDCKTNTSVTITQPAVLSATTTSTNLVCNGVCIGEIDLTPSGGTGAYTYIWSNGATTQDLTLLCAGPYTVTIKDANGCDTAMSVTITEPPALTASIVSTNASCNGMCNGSADLTPGGGTGAYTYSWSNGITTQDQLGTLCVGIYTATVRDANACTTTTSVTITAPSTLTASIISTNLVCNGECIGAADLTPGGGTIPYTYKWSNGATTEDLTSLCANTYSVTVTDANSCTVITSVAITQPTLLTATIVSTNVTCNGLCDGIIDLTPAGGTGAYTYIWSNGATTEDISLLCPGPYTVTIKDANGCDTTATVTITEPLALTASIVSTNVLCNGGCTGSADLTPVGGTGAYTYSWSNGITTEDQLGTLCPGTYTATVRDANACTTTTSATITNPPALTVSTISTNLLCNSECIGAIDLTPGGGTVPYTFVWSNGATTEDLSSLCAGTYTVTVKDANDCKTNTSVTITQPALLTATIVSTNLICNGDCIGAIDLTPAGGTGAYTYNWSNGATTQDLSSLCAGTYTVTLKDANGCDTTFSTTITQPALLTATTTSTNLACNSACIGEIDLTPSGGTGAYTYIWSNGATTQDLASLCAGPYTVTLKDANGCDTAFTVTITQPATLTATIVSTNVLCNGECTGAVDLTPGGGTVPYTFVWSNGATIEDLSSLCAGTYTVTVKDANDCKTNTSVTITQPALLTATIVSTNLICNGDCIGAIDLTPAGGTGAYTYNWSNGATTEDLSSLCAGTYTVTLKDANGCDTTFSTTITQPALLTATITSTNLVCNSVCIGEIDLTPSGGTGAYTYIWSNSATTQDLSSLCAGPYTVTLKDANGCDTAFTVTITQPTALTATIVSTNVLCSGGCTGSADLTPGGGTGGYTYSWSNGITTQDQLGTLCPGTYTATVRDANACTTTTSAAITNPAVLTASTTSTNLLCNSECTGAIDLTPGGGTLPYTYVWSNGATTEDLTSLCANTYTVTVKDANACTTTTSVPITQPLLLTASIIGTNLVCNNVCIGEADLTPSGGTGAYTYIWSNGATTQDLTLLCAGPFTVTLKDANGCDTTATVTITEPPALTASIVSTNASCNGMCNGSADLTPGGGTGAYTYSWSNGITTQDQLGTLCVGIYTATVREANACTTTTSVTITAPSTLTASIISTNLVCNGECIGAADLTPGGGTILYTYKWSNGATTEDLTSLCANTYSVTVTDANSCTVITSVAITQPTLLTATIVSTNVTCNGACNGIIDLTPAGGTGAYTYIWSNSATTQDLSSLCPGSYTVTLKDANGCDTTATVTITEPTTLTTSITSTNALCNGVCNGSADLTPGGGTGGFTYSWSTGATTEDILGTLCAGTHSVTVKDANSCQKTDSVIISQPAVMTTSIIGTNLLCNSACIGEADLTVAGGTIPYTYKWSNSATIQDLNLLCAATYRVTVTDFLGCQKTDSIVITQPDTLKPTIVGTDETCNTNGTGSADLTVTGGTGAYTYGWTNGPTTQDITGLTVGTYTVTVKDANSCATTRSVTIGEANLTATLSSTNVLCNGGSTASIDLTLTFGTPVYVYKWSTGATTEDISGLPIGTYCVTASDANNCTTNICTTITQPPVLSTTIVGTNVLCNGDSTGIVDLTVAGGTGPFTYKWSNSATTEDLIIPIGTYCVTVTDANGCKDSTSCITITQPTALTSSATGTNLNCNSDSTGVVDLTVSGGTLAYTFKWSNASTLEDIDSLPAGNYCATIIDGNGCRDTTCQLITEPTAFSSSIIGTNLSCNGDSSGAADLTVSGGSPAYTYAWSNGKTTEDISNLAAGTYCATTKDSKGCKTTSCITITEPAVLTGTIISTNVLCNGDSTGATDLTTTGGTLSYTYKWSNGSTTEDLSNIPIGTYCVTITDGKSCKDTACVTITQPAALSSTTTGTNILCNGDSIGAVDLTVSGGVVPYLYSWSNGKTTEDISILLAGTYCATIIDLNLCKDTACITITQPSAISAPGVITNATCNGGSNGAINITPSGGTGGYTYKWSNGATTEDISSITAGIYCATIYDANSCKNTFCFTVTEPTITFAGVITTVTCNGLNNGAINITYSGGALPYTYSWSNSKTTEDIDSLIAGIYCVTITEANSCKKDTCFTVTEPAVLNGTIVSTNVLCNGDTTGAADLTVSGGTIAYTYSWSNSKTTEDLSGLAIGTYCVTITDSKQCKDTTCIIITQPTALTSSATGTNLNCNSDSTGAVDLTVSGGTLAYTYKWSNASTLEDIDSLPAGNYCATIIDANGCRDTTCQLITEPTALSSSIIGTNLSCNGDSSGAADLTVSGGSLAYTYAWSNGKTTEDISNLAAGTYCATTKDSKGCKTTSCITITEPAVLTGTIISTNVLCNGDSTGAVDLTTTGGTLSYTYKWSNNSTTEDLSNLPIGTYCVTITDSKSCKDTTCITITQPSALTSSIVSTNLLCNNDSTGAINLTPSGGTPAYTFSWSNAAIFEDIDSLPSGSYCVTIRDANGCKDTNCLLITQPSLLSVNITISTNVSCNGGNDGSATVTAFNGTPPYNYLWSTVPVQTSATATALVAGTYSVIVTDTNGCDSTVSVTITQPSAISLSTSKKDSECNKATGYACVTPSGGTPPYTFSWNTAPGQTDSCATALVAASYVVTVKDAKGCAKTANIIVNDIDAPVVLVLSKTNVSCNGGCDGNIHVSATGAFPPFTYTWSTSPITQFGQTATALCADIYTVTVDDTVGCKTLTNITIVEPTPLAVSFNITPPKCNGDSNGVLSVSAFGGTLPYTYSWSTISTDTIITGLAAGTYTLTLKDALYCILVQSQILTEPNVLTATGGSTDANCNGGTDGTVKIGPLGGTKPYTFIWYPNVGIDSIATGLVIGTYCSTVKDAFGCSVIACGTVNEPPSVTITFGTVDATCDSADGSATVSTTSGGTPGYSYQWSNGQTGNTAINLLSDPYTVTVIDSKSCNKAFTIIINDIGGPTIVMTDSTNVKCNGGNDGSATVSVTAGVSPFSYLWSNLSTTKKVTNLTAGTHTVIVADSNGCESTLNITILQPTPLTMINSIINVSCNGGNNGSITVSGVGGTPGYSYSWSDAQTTATITGLSAGTYTITVKDANNCQTAASINVSQPSAITASIISTNTSCNGLCDGSADLTVSGGTPLYTYLWSNGSTTQDISLLCVGSYTVTIRDNNSCETVSSVVITEPSLLTGVISGTDVSCNNGADGTSLVVASGGTVSYTYSWSNLATTAAVTGLTIGVYAATITDALGCDTVLFVSITEPTPLTISTSSIKTDCDAANGKACATASGGTPPYVFTWNSLPIQTDSCATGLAVGTYAVTITDAKGCKITANVNISEKDGPTVTLISITHNLCNGDKDGSVTVSASGVNPPYDYSWNTGQSDSAVTALSGGTYTVLVDDSAGCTTFLDVTINEPGGISIISSTVNATCGISNGSANVSASGGTPPYTYKWSTTSTNTTITLLNPGIYAITITDANNCTKTASVVVNNDDGPVLVITDSVDVNCNGGSDGSATVSVISGFGGGYSYLWNDVNIQTTPAAAGLIAGSYIVQVTDVNGCVSLLSVSISEPDEVILSFNTISSTCSAPNGTAIVSVSGGVQPYTYRWNDSQNQTTSSATNLLAGQYFVTVTDANGCVKIDSITVLNITGPKITLVSKNDVTCNGGSDGSITISSFSGTTPYTFTWTPNVGTGTTVNNLLPETYTVNVLDSNLCDITFNVIIAEPNKVDIALTSSADSICINESVTFTANSSDVIASYQFFDVNGTLLQSQASNTYSYTAIDSGSIAVKVLAVNAFGCISDTSNVVSTLISSFAVADAGKNLTINASDIAQLNGKVFFADGGIWTTGGTGEFKPNSTTLNAEYIPSQADLQSGSDKLNAYINLILTTVGGCSEDADTMLLIIQKLNIPNVFTPFPASVGQNDVFYIHGLPPNTKLIVYNRWGIKVFESMNYRNDWDGEGLSSDTYYYILEIGDIKKNGFVRILLSE